MPWINDVELMRHPPPPFLVEDVLPEGAVAALVGEPGLGKTFIALDLAFSLASGAEWCGFAVRRAPVAYVIAEGLGGMAVRVMAWRQQRGVAPLETVGVHFWRDAVQLASEVAVRQFAVELNGLPRAPGLIVFDTLARCFVGKDENHARDMGELIRGADALRAGGATVLLLHHSGHVKGRERGSTALRGAVDTLIMAEKVGGAIALKCEKQREAEPFDPIGLRLQSVLTPNGASAIIADAELPAGALVDFPPRWEAAITTLAGDPLSAADWQRATGLSKRTFFRMMRAALESGRVERRGTLYVPRGVNGSPAV